MQLVLASSSPYRRDLLQRLGLPFTQASPGIDESPLPGEDAPALASRLALTKAQALAPRFPDSLLIASDQSCRRADSNEILGKPGTLQRAREQLAACSGKRVDFFTSLVLYDTRDHSHKCSLDLYSVWFRALTTMEIDNYLRLEPALDCAGGFKVEGLGISLFSALEGSDYHSLVGLPLLKLCALLRQAGLNPLLPALQPPA